MTVLVLAEIHPGDRKGLNGVESRSYKENKEIIILLLLRTIQKRSYTSMRFERVDDSPDMVAPCDIS
jgi:hypothetical protein